MRLWCTLLTAMVCLLSPAGLWAQDGQDRFEPREDPALLEEIPNWPSRLVGQWRTGDLPREGRAWIDDVSYYGRLRDVTPPEKLTLADCVALAIANNTQLQLERLGPLGARVQIRRAESIFDSALFADVGIDRYRRQSPSFRAVVDDDGNEVPLDEEQIGALGFFLGPRTSEQHRFNANIGLRKLLVTGGVLQGQWGSQRRKSNSPFQALSPEYSTDFELSLNQPLLRGFGLRFTSLQIRVAETQSSAASRQYEAAISNLVKRVETAYWLLVGTRENVVVRELGLQVANELQRQNEGKFNVGTVPRTSVLEARADVARREAELIEANKLLTNARDALRTVLNVRDRNTDSLITVEPVDEPTVEPVDANLDRSLQLALDNRAELAAAKLDLEGTSMQLKVAENQLLPRLDAVGSVGLNGLGGKAVRLTPSVTLPDGSSQVVNLESTHDGSYGHAIGTAFQGDYYSYVAGIVLEIPLSNAAARAEYQQTRIGVQQSRLSVRQLQENVTAEVKKAINDIQADAKAIEARRLARELAEENVRNQQARFDVGLGTTKDLLDFQDRLTQARAEEVRVLTQFRIDLAELRRVEGTLLDAHNVELDNEAAESHSWWSRF